MLISEKATHLRLALSLGNIPFSLAKRGRSDREEYFETA